MLCAPPVLSYIRGSLLCMCDGFSDSAPSLYHFAGSPRKFERALRRGRRGGRDSTSETINQPWIQFHFWGWGAESAAGFGDRRPLPGDGTPSRMPPFSSSFALRRRAICSVGDEICNSFILEVPSNTVTHLFSRFGEIFGTKTDNSPLASTISSFWLSRERGWWTFGGKPTQSVTKSVIWDIQGFLSVFWREDQ